MLSAVFEYDYSLKYLTLVTSDFRVCWYIHMLVISKSELFI